MMDKEELETEINKNAGRLSVVLQSGLAYKGSSSGGTEFEKLRKYIPGEDPAKNIDWKATLRRPGTYMREYTVMKKLGLFLVQDISTSMQYGSGGRKKNEYSSIMIGSMLKASLHSQINVGFGFSDFKDGMRNVVRPTSHPGIYQRFIESSLGMEYQNRFNLKRLLQSCVGLLSSKTVLLIFSDFLNLGDEWRDQLITASQKFESVLFFAVHDPIEESLPKTSKMVRLQDPETGQVVVVNPAKVREEYEKKVKKREEELKNKVQGAGATYKKVLTNEPFIKPLIQFLNAI